MDGVKAYLQGYGEDQCRCGRESDPAQRHRRPPPPQISPCGARAGRGPARAPLVARVRRRRARGARAVAKGIIEPRIEQPGGSPDQRAALIREIGPRLHARWVRLVVNWSRLEPEQETYAKARRSSVWTASTTSFRARGIRVILTTLFPDKPFYLTEYGYTTCFSLIAARSVTQAQQTTYLAARWSTSESGRAGGGAAPVSPRSRG